ncbi:hypothetical protein NUSPORA_02749 [Nucleospora cyclopteri]
MKFDYFETILEIVNNHSEEIKKIIFLIGEQDINNIDTYTFLKLILLKNLRNIRLLNKSQTNKCYENIKTNQNFIIRELQFEIYLYEIFNDMPICYNFIKNKNIKNLKFKQNILTINS